MRPTLSMMAALLSLTLSTVVQAQAHSVYLGAVHIQLDATMPPLAGGSPVPAPGALLRVGSATTLALGYVYRFAPAWSVELAMGLPPTHKVYGEGFLKPFGQISVVEQLPPTAFINYALPVIFKHIRPEVGVGLNYTHFSGTRSTASGDAASGGPTRIRLSDSWGLAARVGASVQLSKHWTVTGTLAVAHVRSQMRATTSTREGEVLRTTDINFRPMVAGVSLAYGF